MLGLTKIGATRLYALPLAVSILLPAVPQHARACAYDGMLGDGLVVVHERSVEVAIATRDAIVAGRLSNIGPAQSGRTRNYWDAVRLLEGFRQALSSGKAGLPYNVSIVLLDSNLWGRLAPDEDGYDIEIHTVGAQQQDVVVVASEAVLAAVQSGQLTFGEAVLLGLMLVDGPANGASSIKELLVQASWEKQGPGRKSMNLFGPRSVTGKSFDQP
ncbi:hypothetical protein JNB91_29490 [Rhizobium wenxiniae]|uniref:hypothetical protein n=1 Tax=Rhizobium wenxiniae TaxID=1737357 RepID=UPI001C6DDA57|nr:hypothetical protein [Rhizobium wenxiniae]MBW9091907.1 hypothetical protein [Rhizobium wenxiniae]